jgi:hypothetical protein
MTPDDPRFAQLVQGGVADRSWRVRDAVLKQATVSTGEPSLEAVETEAERREPIFKLIEYAVAERGFIGGTLEALARARDPLLARIQVERTSRMPRTQITTESGEVVEHEPIQVRTKLTQSPQDIIDGRLDDLLVSLDQAAESQVPGGGVARRRDRWLLRPR